jgi:hypothetical protein
MKHRERVCDDGAMVGERCVRATHKIYTPWKRETEGGKDCIYVGERVGEKPHERERERGSVRERDICIGRKKLGL